jgi:hypothetical protein
MARWNWDVAAALAFALQGAPALAADAPASVPKAAAPPPAGAEAAPAVEEPMVLEGGEEGTVFKSLQVTGEDLIRIEFERPELRVSLDPRKAPGLEWGDAEDTLKHSGVDYTAPLLSLSATETSPFAARPWFDRYRSGPVARFQPKMEDVKRWSLTIADSRSDTLAVFSGQDDPPAEIAWDGRTRQGAMVPPGVTCSYVLEAVDRAGNRRSFVGEGFVLPAYRVRTKTSEVLLFSGDELGTAAALGEATSRTAPILWGTAWLNQIEAVGAPIEVKASARSFEDATRQANQVAAALRPRVVGDPARIRTVADVRADVPARGTVAVTAALSGSVASAAPAGKQAPAATSEQKVAAPAAAAPSQAETPAAPAPKPEVKRIGSKYR